MNEMTTVDILTGPGSAARAHPARSAMFEASIVTASEWHRRIADFDELSQEQLHAHAAARLEGATIEPLLFRRGGEVVGGALMTIRALPLRLASVAISKWGPMLRRTDDPDGREIFSGMADAIATEYGDRRRMMVSLLTRASTIQPDPAQLALAERGFVAGSRWEHPTTHLMHLRQSDEAMRKNLTSKWRNHFKKAENANLIFEVAEADRLPEFDVLYQEMVARKKFDDLSAYGTLPALMAIDEPGLRPALFFVRHTGDVVAGAVVFRAGDRAEYLYGATSSAALTVNAGHFLQWNIARWLRDNTRARWYCLGGDDGVEGLKAFKTGLSGHSGVVAQVPASANYASAPLARIAGQSAFRIRDEYARLRRRLERLRA